MTVRELTRMVARSAFVLLGCLIAGIRPTVASAVEIAQNAASPTVSNPDVAQNTRATESANLLEVVVTAQKREERLLDVPVSVTSLDGAALANQGAVSLTEYFTQVPGLAVNEQGGGQMNLSIRGVSTGTLQNSTVGVMIDDVPFGSTTGFNFGDVLVPDLDPSSLRRVEVLRGPQGTLYGASSLGGLVKYVTATPDPQATTVRAEVNGTTVDHGDAGYAARAAMNVPVIPGSVAVRVSAFDRHDGGFIDDPGQGRFNVNDTTTWGAHASVMWFAADASVRFSALVQHADADESPSVDTDYRFQPLSGDLVHDRLRSTGPWSRDVQLYSLTANKEFARAALTSISAYGINSVEQAGDAAALAFVSELLYGLGGSRLDNTFRTKKWSQELRLASAGESHLEWLVGAFFEYEDSNSLQGIDAVDPANGASGGWVETVVFPSTYREYAGFADVTYKFTPQFDVQIGARYSKNIQTYHENDTGPLFSELLGEETPVVTNAGSTGHSTTYLVTPRWRLSDDAMVYIRAASGYRPGGPNPGAAFGFPATYEADTTMNYEVGFKANFLEHRLSMDAAAFTIDWSNIQVSQVQDDFLFYTNSGDAKSRGVELAAQLVPTNTLSIAGTLTYLDAKLTKTVGGGFSGRSGDPLPFSGKWTGSLSLEKSFAISRGVTGFVGGTASYVDARPGRFRNDGDSFRLRFPSYTTVELRSGVELERGWKVAAYVKNLGDKRGVLSSGPTLGDVITTDTYRTNVIRPRTIGLSLVKSFN